MNVFFRILISVSVGIIASFLFVPSHGYAAYEPGKPIGPLQQVSQQCLTDGSCDICDLIRVPIGIYKFILSSLGVIALVLFIVGGVKLMHANGDSAKIGSAKKTLIGTAAGMGIVLFAWLGVNTLLNILLNQQIGTRATLNFPKANISYVWDDPCSWIGEKGAGVLTATKVDIVRIPSRASAHSPYITDNDPNSVITGDCSGAICQTGLVCNQIGNDCYQNQINQWNTAISQGVQLAGGRIAQCPQINVQALIKAVMAKESGGQANVASRVGAYGLLQIQPATANAVKKYCGITEAITSDWLRNSANAPQMVCLSVKIFDSLAQQGCGCSVRDLAAGYNGGSGACQASVTCSDCSLCAGHKTMQWECLWNGAAGDHNTCNPGYVETRRYSPRVQFCYGQFQS